MFTKKRHMAILVFLFVVLTGCNSASKEAEIYYDDVYKSTIDDSQDIVKSVEKLVNTVTSSEPEKAIELLNDHIIPTHESLIKTIHEADLTQDDLMDFNKKVETVTRSSEEIFTQLHTIFTEVIEQEDTNEIHLDEYFKKLDNLIDQYDENQQIYEEQLKDIADEYDSFKEEKAELFMNQPLNSNETYEELVMEFVEMVTRSTSLEEANNQDGVEVQFDGEVSFDDTFNVKGQSNLPEGANVQLRIFKYGTENSSLREDTEVNADGEFHFEMDVDEDEFNGEPMEIQVQFIPHKTNNKEFQDTYGAEGEHITGPFTYKVTDAKRTRTAAIAYAYIDFDAGEKASFEQKNWEVPEDYQDVEVWMEEEHVDMKDDYYDITMNSNLAELTGIKVAIEIPGYEVAGYRSSTTVMPDGSFRFQIPRPDVDDADIQIIITSRISRSIEVEELYGEKGEHLTGDLVDQTDKEQLIKYEFTVE